MYSAPLNDLRFCMETVVDETQIKGCPALADYDAALRDSVLDEAARFAEQVLEPLYRGGDTEGAQWTAQGVRMPSGYRAAYAQFVEAGWGSLRGRPEHGGQGMPALLSTAVEEMWASSNLAFKLCPMLTQGAAEAIEHAGTDAQRRLFVPRMVRGEWSGTMNLTEPQAGSDLGLIRTRAVPDGDRYRIFGQKIFITYGEHDLTENIIHLVLARIEGAPTGTRGISMFVVPKFLVNDDGSLGPRNDVQCLSIEHKLGIHASPTCVMSYGQAGGAIGYLVGEANRGLESMFVMMNAARLSVGVEGYAVAERAFQQALAWARGRQQGRSPSGPGTAAIVEHPDVRRMLLAMRSQIEAMRALALYAAGQLDIARHHSEPDVRAAAQSRVDLLIPVVKAHCTETGIELASLGIQVHGGMGYVEETGAAQALRDVRICTIYEGTTGIQAADLVGRKISRDRGAALTGWIRDMRAEIAALSGADPTVAEIGGAVRAAIELLDATVVQLVRELIAIPANLMSVSVPFLRLCGVVAGGWLLARQANVAIARLAAGGDRAFLAGKLQSARFYARQVLPQVKSYATIVQQGATSVAEADPALL
jgi:alkylation response protein AidB-like acyl-CoA dehydrogenase